MGHGFIDSADALCNSWQPRLGLVGRQTPAENVLSGAVVANVMIDGSSCLNCNGHVSTTDGTEYVCDDCGEVFDSADLFLP